MRGTTTQNGGEDSATGGSGRRCRRLAVPSFAREERRPLARIAYVRRTGNCCCTVVGRAAAAATLTARDSASSRVARQSPTSGCIPTGVDFCSAAMAAMHGRTSVSPPSPLALSPPLTLLLSLALGALVQGASAACGPYLKELTCQRGCSQRQLSDGGTSGTLRCVCEKPSDTLSVCTMDFPRAFGPSIPVFADPSSECDELTEFELSGIAEVRTIQARAFDSIARSLRILRLTGNRISSVDGAAFSNLTVLRELILSDNHLETINLPDGNDVPHLEKLDLSRNAIRTVNWQRLTCYGRLTRLDVSRNQLASLDGGSSFRVPASLRSLNLDSNRLQAVTECQFHALCVSANLSELSLRSQSWTCNCDSIWLTKTYEQCRMTDNIDEVRCQYDYVWTMRKKRSGFDSFDESLTSYQPDAICNGTNATAPAALCPTAAGGSQCAVHVGSSQPSVGPLPQQRRCPIDSGSSTSAGSGQLSTATPGGAWPVSQTASDGFTKTVPSGSLVASVTTEADGWHSTTVTNATAQQSTTAKARKTKPPPEDDLVRCPTGGAWPQTPSGRMSWPLVVVFTASAYRLPGFAPAIFLNEL